MKTSIGYGANLNPTTVTAGNGNGTLSATTIRTYDDVGDVRTVDGPLTGTDDTTRFRYDAARRPVATVSADPDGPGALKHRAVRTTYRGDGQVQKVEVGTAEGQTDPQIDAMSVLQRQETDFDIYGRPVATRGYAGSTYDSRVETSYDAHGRPECTAVRMNRTRFGQAANACAPDSVVGTFGPDRVSKTVYDEMSRASEHWSGVGVAGVEGADIKVAYTPNGLVQTRTDGEGNATSYTYDGHDRLLRTTFPSAAPHGATYEELTYESVGAGIRNSPLVVSRRLRDGQEIGYGHDALGRTTSKDLPGAEADMSYGYSLLGELTLIQRPGITHSMAYDGLGRMTSEQQPFGLVTYEYDLAGRRTRLNYPGTGLYVTYDRHVTGEITAIRENGAASGIGVLGTYGYDSLGRRTSLTRGNGTVTNYSYQGEVPLASLEHNLTGATHDATSTFTWNPAGQIAVQTRTNDLYAWRGHYNLSQGYTRNALNQVTQAGTAALGYDARGNLTSNGSKAYTYSSENMLKSATGGVTLHYDGAGRLAEYNTNVSTRFVYDGPNLIAEVDNPAGAVLRRYVHGPGTDEPLVWYEGPGTSDRRFLHADERGSIVAVSNGSGAATAINAYDEYGIPGANNLGRFQYTGQTWFPELALYNYKARFYDPALGRFLQPDPVGYDDGMNMYAYVGGDPVNRRDPTGLQQDCVAMRTYYTEYYPHSGQVVRTWSAPAAPVCIGSSDQGDPGACAANPDCVAAIDRIVVTGFRQRRFDGKRWKFLPWPKEPAWFVYPDSTIASGVTTPQEDRCGQARNRVVAPRSGYIAMLHAHSAGSPGWPGSADFDLAKGLLLYGMFSEEGGNSGVWRMGPGDQSPVRVTGDRPTRPSLTRPGSNVRETAPTEQGCS